MTSVNGKELAVEVVGDGAWTVLVHGLGGTSNVWLPQVRVLRDRFTCVVLDLEGSGRSPATGTLTMAGFGDDLVGLMDSLGIDWAHLVGHSMGTIICQHVAASRPDRVASLALLGPILEPPEAARAGLKDRAATARADGMAPIADALLAAATAAATRARQPVTCALVREFLMGQDPEGYARTCEALAAATAANLAAIQCPVLLVTGDEDKVAPPATAETMAGQIGRADCRILSDCGHWTPIEQVDGVNAALTRFYDGL